MNKLQSFEEFSSFKAEQLKAENEAKIAKTRESAAGNFKKLLSEYGVSSVSELDEEQKTQFYTRLEEGNAFGEAVKNAKEEGKTEFEFQGKTYKVEESTKAPMMYKGWLIKKTNNKFGAENLAKGEMLNPIYSDWDKLKSVIDGIKESSLSEAEIKSDEEFKEYAFTVLKKAFGEEFDETKAQEVVDGILSKSEGDYGTAVGMLTSSLG